MKKRLIVDTLVLLVLALALCGCLCLTGCAQGEVNEEKLIMPEVQAEESVQKNDMDLQISAAPAPAPYAPSASSDVNSTDSFNVNYMGLGEVEFKVNEVTLTIDAPSWAEREVDSAAYLVINFAITNVDVPEDCEQAKDAYINCIQVYSAEAPAPYGTNYPWMYAPDYFSGVRDAGNQKGYFLFSIPERGECVSHELCWTLDELGVQLLRENKIALTCTFAENQIMPLNYDGIKDKTL